MIITQTRSRRTFVGSLTPGDDVIKSLAGMCVDNSVLCGLFSGIGYLRDAKVQNYDLERRGFRPPVTHEGLMHVVSLHGNVSLADQNTVIRIHVIGTVQRGDDEAELVSGELLAGEVLALEFTLSSVDDVRLYRAPDKTGLDPWLHMDINASPDPDEEEDATDEDEERARIDAEAFADDEKGEPHAGDLNPADVGPGDWLQHPTLGLCEVIDSDGDHRATIRLESNRVVELHLGLLDLEPIGVSDEGGHIIKVALKRRR